MSIAPTQETTFNAALPYGVTTLAAGSVGAILAFSASSTAAIVMGVALALIGTYAFLGVLTCGVEHSGKPDEFREKVGKYMLVGASGAIADIITTVAKAVLLDLIFGRKNR